MSGRVLTAEEYVMAIEHLEVRDRLTSEQQPTGGGDLAADFEKTWREVEDDPFLHSARYLSETMLMPLLEALPDTASSRVNGVPIGAAPLRSLDAHCVRASDGRPAVLFNPRVITIMSFYAEMFIDGEYIQAHAPHAHAAFLDEAIGYLLEYFESDGSPKTAKRSLPKRIEELTRMSATAIGSVVFTVSRALAHVAAGHIGKTRTHEISFSNGDVLSLHFQQFTADEQSDADAVAWDWYMRTQASVPVLGSVDAQTRETVPYTYLLASCLIDRNTVTIDPYTDHLTAVERLERFAALTLRDPQDRRDMIEVGATMPVLVR